MICSDIIDRVKSTKIIQEAGMKRIFLSIMSLILLMCFTYLNAQWAKTYGGSEADFLKSAQQTSDGGFVAVGWTSSFGVAVEDIWVLKFNPFGMIEWQYIYGGDDWDDGNDIQQTSDGGYIVAGQTQSFGTGSQDYWILKLNSSGQIEWQHTYGGPEWDTAESIRQTDDGGYIVAGDTRSFGAGLYDIWILKLDSSGLIEWQRTYGDSKSDMVRSIRQTSDRGYIVAGTSYTFGPGSKAIWILKLTSTGDIEWQHSYGGNDSDSAKSVLQTSDGGYIVLAQTGSFGVGLSDLLIYKLSSTGSIEWQHTYGGPLWDPPEAIFQATDEGYILVGDTYSFGAGENDCIVMKLDPTGEIEWVKTYGGSSYDLAQVIQQTEGGDFIVAGNTSSFGEGETDFLMFKISSDGNIDQSCGFSGFIIATTNALHTNPSVFSLPTTALPADTSVVYQSTNISPQETDIEGNLICAKKKKGSGIR
jgi:hypothetical protein